MKYVFLGNNRLAWQVLEWLQRIGDAPAGLVVHPPARRSYGAQILAAADLDAARVFDGSQLRVPDVQDAIRRCGAEMGVSVLFGYLLAPEFVERFPRGVVNLHPSLLPFNRGACPNVWSIVDETPAGVTLHYIDSGVDTGDIIFQRPVSVAETDTGLTLYRKLEEASLTLFQDTWPSLKRGEMTRTAQNGAGSCHRLHDVEKIDRIELDKTYTAQRLINILRARTFPPHRGAYYEKNGRRVYLRLELVEDDREPERHGVRSQQGLYRTL